MLSHLYQFRPKKTAPGGRSQQTLNILLFHLVLVFVLLMWLHPVVPRVSPGTTFRDSKDQIRVSCLQGKHHTC